MLTLWQTTGGVNGTGTYHCTVSGLDLNPETVSWDVPAAAPNYDLAGSRGTGAGLRIKVGEVASNEQDSGATQFANFNLDVYQPPAAIEDSEGVSGSIAVPSSCRKMVNVLIHVYNFFSNPNNAIPARNGCWGFQRSYQNTKPPYPTNWLICHAKVPSYFDPGDPYNAKPTALKAFDDTSVGDPTDPTQPPNSVARETAQIDNCANYGAPLGQTRIYAEFMNWRHEGNEQWCTSPSYHNPPWNSSCWRRNPGTFNEVDRFYAEMYVDDFDVESLLFTLQGCGGTPVCGANPNTSWAAFNIRPLIFAKQHNTLPLYNEILKWCNLTKVNGRFAIYSGSAINAETTIAQIDVNSFSQAMNACTQ